MHFGLSWFYRHQFQFLYKQTKYSLTLSRVIDFYLQPRGTLCDRRIRNFSISWDVQDLSVQLRRIDLRASSRSSGSTNIYKLAQSPVLVMSRDCICSPLFFFEYYSSPNHNTMSVSIFANALRTHSRLRVLTATRVALPATRSISSLVAFRTAVPKNVSLAVSRLFTTSQVTCSEYENDTPRPPPTNTVFVANIPWSATEEDIGDVFSEFGEIKSVRLRAFFSCPFFS